MTNVIRVYQERGDYGQKIWCADGPGGRVSGGADTAEDILGRYLVLSALNNNDVSEVPVEFGHYERVWVKHEDY